MKTIGGDPRLNWNPYYGAPTCPLCGSIKADAHDTCVCQKKNETPNIFSRYCSLREIEAELTALKRGGEGNPK